MFAVAIALIWLGVWCVCVRVEVCGRGGPSRAGSGTTIVCAVQYVPLYA